MPAQVENRIGDNPCLKSSANLRSASNQHRLHWQRMRSLFNLCEKSSWLSSDTVSDIRHELDVILGNGILIYPPTLKKYGITAETTYRQRRMYLGFKLDPGHRPELSDDERKFEQMMVQKQADAQRHNWEWRIAEEAEQNQKLGWYPFFVTLTVDPKMVDPETLWREGKAFRRYIRRLANVVCACIGEKPVHKKCPKRGGRYASEREYVRYAGVLEHGKTREHHHMHLMLWMREIPSKWKICPNSHRLPEYRTERECRQMRRYWKWCIPSQCPALYYRTTGDIWESEYDHCTPIDKETGQPIEIRNVRDVGRYVTKYMLKGTRQWNHRMKATRNLGMTRLKAKIFSLPPDQVEALTWRPANSSSNHSASLTHSVPLGLVRSLAKQQHYLIRFRSKSLALDQQLKTNYGHFLRMQRSVRDGAKPHRMSSLEFYDWVSQLLPEEDGYSEQRLQAAHQLLAGDFPRPRYKPPKPTKIGANNRGHSSVF